MARQSVAMLVWGLMMTGLLLSGCIQAMTIPERQQPIILQPVSPLVSYDLSIIMQHRWRVVEIIHQNKRVTLPALEPLLLTLTPNGELGINTSTGHGMVYQTSSKGHGYWQLTRYPWIAQDCGAQWNDEYTQFEQLFSRISAYEIQGEKLILRGDEEQLQLVIDTTTVPAPQASHCTEIVTPEPNPMVTMYAEAMRIPYAEAERRLILQAEMSLLESKIIAGELLYAGSWMEHQPEFGLVVGFASPDGETLIQKYLVGILWANLVHVKQMPYTIVELSAIAEKVQQVAYQTGIPFAAGTNIPEAKVTFYTPYPEELRRQLEADATLQPYLEEIEYVYQETFAVPADQ